MRIADTNFEDTANADRVTSTAGQGRRSLRGTAGDRRNRPAGVEDREMLIAYTENADRLWHLVRGAFP